MHRWRMGRLLRLLAVGVCVCGSAWAQAGRIDAEGRLVADPEASFLDARAMALYADDQEVSSMDSLLFDERDEASGVRVIALVSPASQPSPSEFYLRIGVWGRSEGPKFASVPTLHLIAPDNSVEVRAVWSVNAYDLPGGEANTLPETTATTLYAAVAPPLRFALGAGPLRTVDARFVSAGERGDLGSDVEFALEWENRYDTYTIPGVGNQPAAGYEYVIPLHVTDGRLTARVIVSGIAWETEDGATSSSNGATTVAVDFEHDERAAARKRRADFEPSASDIVHTGVIVRVNSNVQGRKPYMRVDAVIRYRPEVAQANAAAMERLRGGEGKAILGRALMSTIPTAEEMEADQLSTMERAVDAIRKAIVEAGFPSPAVVSFSSWVIQG